jgi:ABC-type lipoprotein release transport system permease subunit
MKLTKLALRNLFRNTRRTVITLAAIGLGLAMMIFTVNFQNGSYMEMIRTGISSMAGHVVVQADGYQDDKDAELVVTEASEVVEALRQAYPDAVVAPRIFTGGLLMSSHASVGGAISGLEPQAERRVQELHERVIDGAWLGEDDREIVIGIDMAETLDVELGDKLVYMGQNGSEEVVSRLFRVCGVYRTGAASIDGRMAFVHLAAAQELLGGGDVANMVTLHMPDPQEAFEAAPRIEGILGRPELDVRHWKDALPELFALIQMDRGFGDVMLAVIGLIVAFGVLNTLMMSVLERTREFGVMLSLGMKPRQIAWLVLLEGVVLGLLGAVVGMLLGLAFSWPTVHYGIDYSGFMGGDTMESGGIVMSTLIKGEWDPLRMCIFFAGAVFFCLCAALYPAWSISKLRPVQALRHH